MFELGAGILEEGERRGIKKGREAERRSRDLQHVKEVMRKLNYSAEEALGLLGISGEQKEDVLEALAKEKDGVAISDEGKHGHRIFQSSGKGHQQHGQKDKAAHKDRAGGLAGGRY